MKPFRWSAGKNEVLQVQRGVSFEAVVVAIESGDLLDIVEHPNQARYPGQRILVVLSSGYVHLVPYGHLENSVFALGKPEHKKPHKGGFARVFE